MVQAAPYATYIYSEQDAIGAIWIIVSAGIIFFM